MSGKRSLVFEDKATVVKKDGKRQRKEISGLVAKNLATVKVMEPTQSVIPEMLLQKERILKVISKNDITIINAETGSGKTTLLPRLLFETGYSGSGKFIGVTVPKRATAVVMMERISTVENISGKLIYVTNVTLLNELKEDNNVSKYSVICIDDAHDRTLYSDILIGVLSRVVRVRAKKEDPLKLVIMTGRRIEEFETNTALFKSVPGRLEVSSLSKQVNISFSNSTSSDPIPAALEKIKVIHETCLPGGILVFTSGIPETSKLLKALASTPALKDQLHILPFHANLSAAQLKQLFETPPNGSRLCIVATSIAESSFTIPSIRYVIDFGRTTVKVWNKIGFPSFIVEWCSKVSANERAKRAKNNGQCYRLYSSKTYQSEFKDAADPEILAEPLDKIILGMKSINLRVTCNFPFITHPGLDAMGKMEKQLYAINALEMTKTATNLKPLEFRIDTARITTLGSSLFLFPVNTNYARVLELSFDYNITELAIAVVAGLSVYSPFMDQCPDDSTTTKLLRSEWKKVRQSWILNKDNLRFGDLMMLLLAIIRFVESLDKEAFCRSAGLNYAIMQNIQNIRTQLTARINDIVVALERSRVTMFLRNPTEKDAIALRQIFLSGHPHSVAKLMDTEKMDKGQKSKYKYAYLSHLQEEPVFLHDSSVMRNRNPPKWVVYLDNFKSNGQLLICKTFAVEEEWITPKNITNNMRVEIFFYGLPDIRFNEMLDVFAPRLQPVCDGMLLKGRNMNSETVVIFPAGIINLYTGSVKFVEGSSTTANGHDWTLMERKAIVDVLREADKIFLPYYTYKVQPTGRKSYPAFFEMSERIKRNKNRNQDALHAAILYFEKKTSTCYRFDSQNTGKLRNLETQNFKAIKNFLVRELYLDYKHWNTVPIEEYRVYDTCALVGVNCILQLFNVDMDITKFNPMLDFDLLLCQAIDELNEVGNLVGGIIPTFVHLQALNQKMLEDQR